MKGLLLRRVVMILVRSRRLRAVQAKRIARATSIAGLVQKVRIAEKQPIGIAINGWRVRRRDEPRFVPWIQGVGIGAEVVIEGDVFTEDHHHMLNRSGC